MRYAGNNLSCQSCHLQAGTQRYGMPLIGVYAVFPVYIARENEVRTIEDRIEGCMERSMNGRALPVDGKEMKALVAYLQFLSTGVPIGSTLEGRGSPALPMLDRAANPSRGAEVFAQKCAVCHQANGQGLRKGAVATRRATSFRRCGARTASMTAPACIASSPRRTSFARTCRSAPGTTRPCCRWTMPGTWRPTSTASRGLRALISSGTIPIACANPSTPRFHRSSTGSPRAAPARTVPSDPGRPR